MDANSSHSELCIPLGNTSMYCSVRLSRKQKISSYKNAPDVPVLRVHDTLLLRGPPCSRASHQPIRSGPSFPRSVPVSPVPVSRHPPGMEEAQPADKNLNKQLDFARREKGVTNMEMQRKRIGENFGETFDAPRSPSLAADDKTGGGGRGLRSQWCRWRSESRWSSAGILNRHSREGSFLHYHHYSNK